MANTIEELLARGVRKYPERSAQPNLSVIPDRPDVGKLYGMLETLNQVPEDYSGVERVAKGRAEQADRDMLAGLILGAKGGKALAPYGAKLFTKALGDQGVFRPNAADTGYIDPETGKMVENPATARARDERLITGRIDALLKEQEAKGRLALAQGNANAADAAKQNSEQLKALLVMIAQQNADTARMRAESYAEKQGNKDDVGKALNTVEQEKLRKVTGNYRTLDHLDKTFKKEYEGGVSGTLGGSTKTWVATNFPQSAESMLGKDEADKLKSRRDWWSQQKYMDELPTRHEIFGATLTTPERESWKGASITEGMLEPEIRKHLRTRRELLKGAIAREEKQLTAGGKKRGQVRAFTEDILPEEAAPQASTSDDDALINKWLKK